jgi:transcription antitermination factor NusG
MPDSIRWSLAEVYTKADFYVNEMLLERGFRTVFPFTIEKSRAGGSSQFQGRVVPVYSGYLFVGVQTGQSHSEVLAIPRVRDFLRYGDKTIVTIASRDIVKIRDQHWAELRVHCEIRNITREYAVGEWVPVPTGPLANVPCRIDAIDESGQIEASVAGIRVKFSVADLRGKPLENSRGRPKLSSNKIGAALLSPVKSST